MHTYFRVFSFSQPFFRDAIRACYVFSLSCTMLHAIDLVAPVRVYAAEVIVVRSGPFERSLPIADLHRYAETGEVSAQLRYFLSFVDQDKQRAVRGILQTQVPVNLIALDQVLNGKIGIQFLAQIAQVTPNADSDIKALRAAAILGIHSGELSLLSFLDAYPKQRLVLVLSKGLRVVDASVPRPPSDRLSNTLFWQTWVEYQTVVNHHKSLKACVFGDSISAELGETLGTQTYNFAIGGMSTVSLIEQINHLVTAQVNCRSVAIAIGTNDAWYTISDEQFVQNLHEIIALVHQLGSSQIVLLPAFYSTLPASKNPNLAGALSRVEAINQLLKQVAAEEHVPVDCTVLNPLFEGQVLKANLTTDGVHLNAAGLKIYRQALLKVIHEQGDQ